jgi:hypothetical protein
MPQPVLWIAGPSQQCRAAALVTEVAKVTTPAGTAIPQAESLLPPVRNIPDNASEELDLLGRCASDPGTGEWTGNQDCLSNRLIPAMKNVERMAAASEKMANAIADLTPATAAAV